MKVKSNIKNYLQKRKEITDYYKIFASGYMLRKKVDKMGTAKIIKPSYYEVDDLINTCIKLKDSLINLDNELKMDKVSVINHEIDQLKKLQILKLTDCKDLSAICCKIGSKLVNQISRGGFWSPISVETVILTVGEIFALGGISVAIACIIAFLKK